MLLGAHGDGIQAVLIFNSRPDENDPARAVLEGTFILDGGTGRFEEATGGGTLSGSGAANPAGDPEIPIVFDFSGTITY